jgi:hypothetical protein
MATPLIGNIIVSNITTSISATTATGIVSGATQVLASNILANPTLGSNNYTYQWTQTGTPITFTAATSNSTNCTYNSLSVAGSTTIYCTVTDTWTGVQSVTANCVITWPVQTITQNIVISGSPTYNGSGQAYTLTASTGPAPTGSPASFTNAGTYNSSNITLTPSPGYVVGTVTGTFTINKANLSVSGFAVQDCGGFSVARMTFTVSGLQGGDTGSLTTWIGTSSPTSVAPVSTNDSVFGNAVASPGYPSFGPLSTNPITVSNGTPFAALYLCVNEFGNQYWVQVTGSSNYNASVFDGPLDQQCGS